MSVTVGIHEEWNWEKEWEGDQYMLSTDVQETSFLNFFSWIGQLWILTFLTIRHFSRALIKNMHYIVFTENYLVLREKLQEWPQSRLGLRHCVPLGPCTPFKRTQLLLWLFVLKSVFPARISAPWVQGQCLFYSWLFSSTPTLLPAV